MKLRQCYLALYPYLSFILVVILFNSCGPSNRNEGEGEKAALKGKVIIFHAGSMAVPLKEISRQFEEQNPQVTVLLEAAGSVDCARKITDLHKPCDLMASSDYKVIDKFLVPEYTSWQIPFAANSMVIAYKNNSRLADRISSDNWYEVLQDEDVHYGRSDPASDPCGYRTEMVLQLAEKYYSNTGMASVILDKDRRYIRPKEVDLLSLLDVGEIDYIFIYKSVAIQHRLEMIILPDEINLGDPQFEENYRSSSVEIPGSQPGQTVTIHGDPMVYSITMLDSAPNRQAAMAFLQFMMKDGLKVVREMGQEPIVPMPVPYFDNVPKELQEFVRPL